MRPIGACAATFQSNCAMTLADLFRTQSLIALLTLVTTGAAHGQQEIIPLRSNLNFSVESANDHRSVVITGRDRRPAYVLSLEPDFDVRHDVVVVELVVRHARGASDAANLLDSTGRLHGLQPYDFAAKDLARGAQHSSYGARREVILRNLALTIRIDIAKASVRPTPPYKGKPGDSNYTLDDLKLKIQIRNSDQ